MQQSHKPKNSSKGTFSFVVFFLVCVPLFRWNAHSVWLRDEYTVESSLENLKKQMETNEDLAKVLKQANANFTARLPFPSNVDLLAFFNGLESHDVATMVLEILRATPEQLDNVVCYQYHNR